MINDIQELSLSEFLKKRLRDMMNDKADFLATGDCNSFPEYKKISGVIEGLALAEREMLDLIDQHQRE